MHLSAGVEQMVAGVRRQVQERPERWLLLLVGVLYLLITVWMTWPLPRLAGSTVQDPGDPVFEIWVMRAVQNQLVNDPLNLYHANAFYPFDYSLAYSEEAISTAILGWPVQILTGNDILAYNLVLLSTFWLVAFGMFLLARELGAHPGAAFLAGVLAGFAPTRYAQLSHLHMLVIGWMLIVLWALTVYVRRGDRRYLVVLGVALAIQLLASLHLAVYTSMVLALYLPCLFLFERRTRNWTRADLGYLALALGLPYLLFVPTLLPHLAAGDQYGFVRDRDEVAGFGASIRNYLSVSMTNRFWPDWMERRGTALFPGAIALLGALLALAFARKWGVLFAGVLTLVAGIFSFGFTMELGGRTITMPYSLIYDLVPPIQNIRVVSRYGLLTAIGIPLLAAFGYSAVWQRLRPRLGSRALVAGIGLTALLTVAACIELRAIPGTSPVDTSAETMEVYEWLGTLESGPVIEFPAHGLISTGSRPPHGVFQPIRYMYGSTRHWQPLFNGYSGYVPPQHQRLLRLFQTEEHPSLVTAENVGVLADLGIRYVVIHRTADTDQELALATADAVPELERIAGFGSSVVYEVSQASRQDVIGRLTAPEQVARGAFMPVRLHWQNPNRNLALAHMEHTPALYISWVDERGDVVKEDLPGLSTTMAVPAGESIETLVTIAPDTPGLFTLIVDFNTEDVPPWEQTVEVQDIDWQARPLLEFVGIDWGGQQELIPGSTLEVHVTWRLLEKLALDLSSTVQILDATPAWVAGADLLPGSNMPLTSTWQVGDEVTLVHILQIPETLPPGEYSLLTALYIYRPEFPRIPVLLPDGSVVDSVVVDGLFME